MKPVVSFVIPVYNVRDYIERCLRSVVAAAQRFAKGTEIICVDDGSTDGSGEILDRLASAVNGEHSTCVLKIIHQANAGVSTARNAALAAASGKYLVFVDSDDCVTDGYLLRAIPDLEADPELDVWIGQRTVVDNDYNPIEVARQPPQIPAMETAEPIRDFLQVNGRYYLYCVWGKVFRKDLFDRFSLVFNPELNIGEDSLLMSEAYARSRKVKIVANELNYVHCWRNGSLVGRHWADLVPQYFQSSRLLEECATGKHLEDKLGVLIAQRALSRVRTMFDKGYSYAWMARYIEALCRHPDFKQRVPRNIVRYAHQPYKTAGMILLILPARITELILKLAVCLKGLRE